MTSSLWGYVLGEVPPVKYSSCLHVSHDQLNFPYDGFEIWESVGAGASTRGEKRERVAGIGQQIPEADDLDEARYSGAAGCVLDADAVSGVADCGRGAALVSGEHTRRRQVGR